MSIINREDIQRIINDDWLLMDDCEGNKNCDAVKELARIALASLEAEPVAYADPQAFRNFQAGAARREWMWRNTGEDLIPLFTTQPAPVSVPAELTRKEYKRRFMEDDNFDDTFRGGWNAAIARFKEMNKCL